MFRKYWLRIAVVLVVIVLMISAIIRAITPDLPPVATLVQSNLRFQTGIEFSPNVSVEIPSKLSTYSSDPTPEINNLAENLAQQFQLNPHPKFIGYWVNEDESVILNIEGDGRLIAYKIPVDPFALPQRKVVLSKEELKQSTIDFINRYQLFSNYTLSDGVPYEITAEHYEPLTLEDDASYFLFSVYGEIDGHPYLLGNQIASPAEIIINVSGNVTKAIFYPLSANLTKVSEYSTLSLDEIINNAQNGELIYINAAANDPFEPQAEDMQSVEFTSATLEYRQNEQNGYILPYVHFYGTGVNEAGEVFDVEAISPAIAVQ